MTRAHIQTSFARKPLDYVLSGPGAVRVLRSLLSHGGYLSVSRLADEAQMTPMGVRKVLDDLVRNRLVHITGSARSRLYKVIAENPLVEGLNQLFKVESDRFDNVIAVVRSATARPRILASWLFGSVARYTDTPESDLDVAVVTDGDTDYWADRLRSEITETLSPAGMQVSLTMMSSTDLLHHAGTNSALWSALVADAIVIRGHGPKQLVKTLKSAS